MNIQIREELLPADREALENILRSCKFFREDEIAVALELIDERLHKGKASDYHFLVAMSGDRVVGYCCYGLVPCTVHSYDLYWIVVAGDFRGKGLGTRLLEASERAISALGGNRVYIETSMRPFYEPTRAFYIARGYTQAAVLDDFYAPGDAKVIYVKVI